MRSAQPLATQRRASAPALAPARRLCPARRAALTSAATLSVPMTPVDTRGNVGGNVVSFPRDIAPEAAFPVSSGLDFVDLIGLPEADVWARRQDAEVYRNLVPTAGPSVPRRAAAAAPADGAFNIKQLKSYRDNVTRNLAPTVALGFAAAAAAAGHRLAVKTQTAQVQQQAPQQAQWQQAQHVAQPTQQRSAAASAAVAAHMAAVHAGGRATATQPSACYVSGSDILRQSASMGAAAADQATMPSAPSQGAATRAADEAESASHPQAQQAGAVMAVDAAAVIAVLGAVGDEQQQRSRRGSRVPVAGRLVKAGRQPGGGSSAWL